MTYVAAATIFLLIAVVAFMAVMLYRQQISHLAAMARLQQLNLQERDGLLELAERERSSLLDRIQHPTVRQVIPADYVAPEPPRDAAELTHVGTVVPEFVHVGRPPGEDEDPMDWIGMEIPDNLTVEGMNSG